MMIPFYTFLNVQTVTILTLTALEDWNSTTDIWLTCEIKETLWTRSWMIYRNKRCSDWWVHLCFYQEFRSLRFDAQPRRVCCKYRDPLPRVKGVRIFMYLYSGSRTQKHYLCHWRWRGLCECETGLRSCTWRFWDPLYNVQCILLSCFECVLVSFFFW